LFGEQRAGSWKTSTSGGGGGGGTMGSSSLQWKWNEG